jgi:glucosamine--fructose-6-phosphate aminotransferase (isomerizing)
MGAGDVFLSEIRDQPAALGRLIEHASHVSSAAKALTARAPRLVRMVAHGSSHNAALYGTYAFGLLAGWTALRDSISLSTYFDADLDFSDTAVIALSQSGQTPDVISYVERARARGAFCLALTNDVDSALETAADVVVPLFAGPERAVAATKTYLNQLAALALLAGFCGRRGAQVIDHLSEVANLVRAASVLELNEHASRLRSISRMFVVARGPQLATARETALKLTEVARVVAEALSATDLMHGPVAAVDRDFPIWVVASDDASLPSVVSAVSRARGAGATVVACGDAANRLEDVDIRLPVPPAPTEILSPLVAVVPGQLFTHALALAKGLDPDRPSNIEKVTLAP